MYNKLDLTLDHKLVVFTGPSLKYIYKRPCQGHLAPTLHLSFSILNIFLLFKTRLPPPRRVLPKHKYRYMSDINECPSL